MRRLDAAWASAATANAASAALGEREFGDALPTTRHPQPLRIVVPPPSAAVSAPLAESAAEPVSFGIPLSAPALESPPIAASPPPASPPDELASRHRPVATQLATPPMTAHACPGQHDRGTPEHAGMPIHSTHSPPDPHSESVVHA